MRARLFVKRPAVSSNTKTETMAISDIRKAVLFMASTSDGVVVVFVVVNRRPTTVNKNRVEFII
jgi:hypothetical protein